MSERNNSIFIPNNELLEQNSGQRKTLLFTAGVFIVKRQAATKCDALLLELDRAYFSTIAP
jgi:hypothetical protein